MAEADVEGGTSRGYFRIWAATVPMISVCIISLSANGAILAMFVSRRGLRRSKNMYFANLALADFLTGVSMPYKLSRDLHFTWDTGTYCRVYQTIYQSLAYVSFLSIFLITLDKWRAVHYPVSYRSKSTKYFTVVTVMLSWVISFSIFTAPQIWWESLILTQTQSYYPRQSSTTKEGNLTSRVAILVATSHNNKHNASTHIQDSITKVSLLNPSGMCPEVYHLNFKLSIFFTTLMYCLPLAAMAGLNISLYLKIKWRKSVEVQRSTSVTDTYFLTLKRLTPDLPENSMTSGTTDDSAKESLLKNSDNKLINKHLAICSRDERRHSSLPAISPILQGRTSSGRRVSMPESNSGGGCRYVGRKWSGCAPVFGNNQAPTPNPMANLAPRVHNEDMVQDILVKQDRKTSRCLCLMLAALVTCWLPHGLTSVVNAQCWCLFGATMTSTSWLYHLDHAVNPFLYGLMFVQFQNVIKQWLLIERVHAFKMRDTLILKNLEKKFEYEESIKQRSPNPQTKQSQFQVPHVRSHLDMTSEDVDNTPL